MPTFTLAASALVSPMKAVRDLVGNVEVDLTRVSTTGDFTNPGAFEYFINQGMKYGLDAAISHATAAKRAPKGAPGEEGYKPEDKDATLSADEARAVVDAFLARIYAPEFKAAAREAAPALSPEEEILHAVLGEKFTAWGLLRRANKKAGTEAVTVASLIAAHGSPMAAFGAAAEAKIYATAKANGWFPESDNVPPD